LFLSRNISSRAARSEKLGKPLLIAEVSLRLWKLIRNWSSVSNILQYTLSIVLQRTAYENGWEVQLKKVIQ
jgi:hypothetical protein